MCRPLLLLLLALATPSSSSASSSPEGATISSGVIWNDVDGKPVHAHGAGILLPHTHPAGVGGKYFMVGATQKTEPGWLSEGINMYSSPDLEHWTFEAEIFHNTSITTPLPEGEIPYYRIERPKVIYNNVTRKYVMYFHLDSNGFKLGMVGVCTCDTVAGKYEFVHGFQPDGQRSLDMGLFQDTDGSAYLVRSVDNHYAGFTQLTPDYLKMSSDGIISKGPKCEGQAVWRTGDDYYLLGSHLTGWSANAAILSHTKGPLKGARWTVLGNPSGDSTTFNSQSTFVLPCVVRHADHAPLPTHAQHTAPHRARYLWRQGRQAARVDVDVCGRAPTRYKHPSGKELLICE
jgi:hypothetical protein